MAHLTTALIILTYLCGCVIDVSDSKTGTAPKSSPVLNVECNFGVKSYPTNTTFRTNSASVTKTGQARRCMITHKVSSAIVRVSLDSIEDSSYPQFLYATVFDKNGGRFTVEAKADDVRRKRVYRFHSCPNFHPSDTTVLNIVFFSTPVNGPFSLGIDVDDKVLQPGRTKEVNVRQDGLAEALALEIVDEGSFEQLEITATSDSEDTVYYLLVSQTCALVRTRAALLAGQKGTGKVLQLTFSTFGRITLSRFSFPKIAPGRWFVGVQVRDAKPNTSASKTVRVRQDIRQHTSETPVIIITMIALGIGLLLAILAHFCMNPDYANSLKFNCTASFKNWIEVITSHWWSKGFKTFSYTTCAIAIIFGVVSIQFVTARWFYMIETGNRDICYYNDACYRPTYLADVPSNLMLSNIPYIVHGLILALFISFREANCLRSWKNAQHDSERSLLVLYNFSVAYSFAWGLIFLGLYSTMYHLCPSRLTFQYDSTFMFINTGLITVAFHNSYVTSNVLPQDPDVVPYGAKTNATPIQASKFYLCFVAPLIFLDYIGSLRDTIVPTRTDLEVLFWFPLVVWLIAVHVWAVAKVFTCKDFTCKPYCPCCYKWFAFIVEIGILILIILLFHNDSSQILLMSCLGAVLNLVVGLFLVRVHECCKRECAGNMQSGVGDDKSCKERLTLVLFSILAIVFWIVAIALFKGFPTTEKVASPHVSRTHNKECIAWGYFDYHDIWHILSSFALFTSAFLVINTTRSLEKRNWFRMYQEAQWLEDQLSGATNRAYEDRR